MSKVCVEFAHTYFQDLIDGAEGLTDNEVGFIESYTDKPDEVVTLVVIDDTGHIEPEWEGEERERNLDRLANEYIDNLRIEPDVWLYESDFDVSVEHIINNVPEVESEDLNDGLDAGLFYRSSKDGLYLYGTYKHDCGHNSLNKVRLTDERDGAKSTGYTCAVYDASMVLSKLGQIPSPDDRIVSDVAVTFHNKGYLDSIPCDRSDRARKILQNTDITNHSEDNVYGFCHKDEPEPINWGMMEVNPPSADYMS
jgi:hypothetical protein